MKKIGVYFTPFSDKLVCFPLKNIVDFICKGIVVALLKVGSNQTPVSKILD